MGLPSKIDAIKDFEWGTNNSPENLAQGFTHCFFVTFADDILKPVALFQFPLKARHPGNISDDQDRS